MPECDEEMFLENNLYPWLDDPSFDQDFDDYDDGPSFDQEYYDDSWDEVFPI